MTEQEEEFFIGLFLPHYNKLNNSNFEVKTRPEKDEQVNGTYDYLGYDKNLVRPGLAIELTGLHKSQSNVEINKILEKLLYKVRQELKKENLDLRKTYLFHFSFKDSPRKAKDRDFHVKEIVKLIQHSLEQHKFGNQSTISRMRMQSPSLIDEFSIHLIDDNQPNIQFMFSVKDNQSFDIQNEALVSLINILNDNNPKLGIPKNENKKTILLIINFYILANERHILNAYQSLPSDEFRNIDEIYFINQKSFSEDYNILKIK